MTLRTPHGNAAKFSDAPRVEVLPVDELPVGVPAPSPQERPADRGPRGAFAPGNSLARLGGAAKRGQTKLAQRLHIGKAPHGPDFAPYQRSAVSFRRAHCTELARTVGGGVCGSAPSSLIASAALQLAWSRYFSDQAAAAGGDPGLALKASRMADASRQNLLAAHELCAKEAVARGSKAGPVDYLAAFRDDAEPLVRVEAT